MSKDWDAWERETYAAGVEAGMLGAAQTLREAASRHEADAAATKNIAEAGGHALAASILRSYANGLEMMADNVKGPPCKVEFGQ